MGFHPGMSFIADLHIHSRFSRATSRSLDAERLALWAAKKGISVLGSGDITHPAWIAELQDRLVEAEEGLFRLRPDLEQTIRDELPPACRSSVRFMLSAEISCIYKKNGRTRKLHHLVLLPGFEAAKRLNERLDRIGNITSDGRPILGLDSRDLLEIVLETDDRACFIPAHVWTPWFSLFGSKSGFDTLEECFEDLSPHIHALETGLSSDPPMNRRLSALDPYILVSNSDAHSPSKLGREANLLDTELAYDPMIRAMTDGTGFLGTIEFFPEEGKYHLDGHRKCAARMEPRETKETGGLCPKCGAPVTVGVLSRVDDLADRETPEMQRPFHSLIPLTEILSELLRCGPATKKVSAAYEALLADLGPELDILMSTPVERIEAAGGPLLARAVKRMREGRVIRLGGYDGEYGVIRVFDPAEMDDLVGQGVLFAPPKQAERKKSAPRSSKRPQKKTSPPLDAGVEENRPRPFGDPLLDPLNPAQQKAALHRGGHLLIKAGPGTGKTLTLTHRIAHMLREGIALPEEVLALTFTNKAAGEMRARIERLRANAPEKGGPRVATFHRFCLETLRQSGEHIGIAPDFTICSEADARALAREAFEEAGTGGRTFSGLLSRMSACKRRLILQDRPAAEDPDLEAFLEVYQRRLRALGMLDLDDLEVETLRLFRERPATCRELGELHPHVFVDEYQDTSPAQAALLRALAGRGGCTITAIGDPDQAIYGFRGADVGPFLRFSKDFPGAVNVMLERSYRATRTLLDGAAALLDIPRPLEGGNGQGGPILTAPCATHREEAEMVVEQIEKLLGGTTLFSMDSGRVGSHEGGGEFGFGDMAVLYRLNAQAEAFEEAFQRAGIPYVRSGEKPLIAQAPADLLWRFLQARCRPEVPFFREAYLRLLKGDRGRGERSLFAGRPAAGPLTDLIDEAAALHGLDGNPTDAPAPLRRLRDLAAGFSGGLPAFLDALALDRGIDHEGLRGDRVAFMSFHAAKGLEWPVVFITGAEDGLMPLSLYASADEDEERRLLYVAVTRARDRVILSWAARRSLGGRTLEAASSPFLRRLPGSLCAPVKRAAWKAKRRQEQLQLF